VSTAVSRFRGFSKVPTVGWFAIESSRLGEFYVAGTLSSTVPTRVSHLLVR